MSLATLSLSIILQGALCQFLHHQPYIDQRIMMYPVRTNCQYMRCNRSRYRWNYQPTGSVLSQIDAPYIFQKVPMVISPMLTRTPYPTKFTFITYEALGSVNVNDIMFHVSTLPTPSPEVLRNLTEPPKSSKAAVRIPSTTVFLGPDRKEIEIKFFNPCLSGRPLMNEFEIPISCNYLQPNGGCPEDYWCHIGASFATTSCCPKTDILDRCEMQRATGDGDELVARWYYDNRLKQCRRFLYKGIRGNMNNFVTKTQCIDACETSKVVDSKNPCRFGHPARYQQNRSLVMCGPNDTSRCPQNYYCHLGETPETTEVLINKNALLVPVE
ncbi:hypothetical protein KIN20_008257 [Parelaphostrongylus tenuis]|uniref:BPTI/Kunitz inhibitor domain-containing protein n=1 Tax=Parelaphostrongylus tenuis TaxID=148309 RepID=A0AAD5M9I6_PARTN|nr:hypothetical protein KIN20_008257 [Parelaphostrongylus tenuis]